MENSVKLLAVVAFILAVTTVNAANINTSQIDALKAKLLPPEFSNTTNISIDELKKIFHAKCKKASGTYNATVYKEIEDGAVKFQACLGELVNVTLIQQEIEIARPIGEMDSVFHKYCGKAPQLEKCIKDFNEEVRPCLTTSERQQNTVLMRIVGSLLGFMCSRGGDQMALFVAEQGPECMEANKEAITNCANHSFAEYWPKDGKMPDFFNLPEIVLSPEHCVDFERFEKCTLHHLEQCQDITPANVAESVFKFVKNETSCRSWIDEKANQRPVLRDSRNNGAAAHMVQHFSLKFMAAFWFLLFMLRLKIW